MTFQNTHVAADAANLVTHRSYLLRIARASVANAWVAEDLVADTLARAFEYRHRFRADSAVRTWLTVILKHHIVDMLRKQTRESMVFHASRDAGVHDRSAENALSAMDDSSDGRDPADVAHANELLEKVHDCLAEMSHSLRASFVDCAILGNNAASVSRRLGISSANVWTRVHRARAILRTALAVES